MFKNECMYIGIVNDCQKLNTNSQALLVLSHFFKKKKIVLTSVTTNT